MFPVLCVALLSTPALAATPMIRDEVDATSSARLTLVDDAMHEDGEMATWRLDAETFAPEELDGGDLRWRVKVRPNRAMGRMSLSF